MATQKKRTLEEFLSFNKQPEREEYITAPEYVDGRPVMKPQKDGTATFKSKSGTLKKDAQGKETAELVPLEVDATPEEAQEPREKKVEPAPAPAPVGEAPEFAPRYEAPQPKAAPSLQAPATENGPAWWERLLIGATPALVGLLSGNELEGMELSGKTLADTEAGLYKRKWDLDSKLAEYRAKKAMGATSKNERKPSFARQELYDPKTGKTYVHSIIDGQDAGVLGEASPNKVRDSYMKEVMYNPETRQMEVATINPRTREVTFHGRAEQKNKNVLTDLDFQGESTKAVVNLDEGKVVNYLGKTPEKKSPYADLEEGRNKRFGDQKLLDLTKEFVKPTGNYNKMKENLDGIVMAAEQLNLGNPRANAGLQNYLARNIYGEKGPLSDSDLARLAGDPSYGAVIDRFLNARLTGTLGALDRQDIRQILDLAYKVQVEKMNSEAARFGNAFKSIGYDPTPGIQAYVKGSVRPMEEFIPGNITRVVEAQAPRGPKAGTVQDGFRFKGGDPAKKENWEKVK